MRPLFALVALVALLVCSGCSLFNQPDRDKLVDGGGMDAGPPDGHFDANMDGGIEACVATDELCNTGIDENCNGLIDCADFACAQQVGCCAPGSAVPAETWADYGDWTRVPATASGFPETEAAPPSGRRIINFSGSPAPSGIVTNLCEPLAAGRSFKVRMRRTSACAECFASFVLTPSANARERELILDDLAVTLHGDGHIETTQNHRAHSMTDAGFADINQDIEITVDVVPGADALGRASLLATVTVLNNATTVSIALEEGFAFIAQEVLLTGPGEDCATVPGLNLAFQGVGAGISVGAFTRTALECVNPGQFYGSPEDCATGLPELTGATTSLDMDAWASGGLSAPSLIGHVAAGTTNWQLFVDGTSVDRTLEDVTYLGYAIGHARADVRNWCSPWSSADEPKVATCNDSTCLGIQSSCACAGSSAREPSAMLTDTGFVIAYAVQSTARMDAYDIAVQTALLAPTSVVSATAAEITRAEHVSDCDSLRDPMIVRAGVDVADGYWVFFTCERDRPYSEIRAIKLGSDLSPGPTATVAVVRAPEAGTYSAGALYAPEVLVEYDPSTDKRHVYRMWVMARDATQSRVSVAVFQGQLDAQQAANGELPTFVPFGANPIITEDHAIFRDCGDCDLLGLSVARDPRSTTLLRFLVARRVNGGSGADYQLVPYEQYWSSPFPEM